MRSNMAEHPTVRSAASRESWPLHRFVEQLTSPEVAPAIPFSEPAKQFCAALSEALFGLPGIRTQPEIVALAYWLRPSMVEAVSQSFADLEDPNTLLVPRGLVLHVPPANVETLFVYSWTLSLLVGNINVVRVSERESVVIDQLRSAIGTLLQEPRFEPVARINRFVHTGHSDEISSALSAIADLRVVWGGDATIEHFRSFPLPPRGRELTFPDRHSLAILGARAVSEIDDAGLDDLTDRFFNDAYWFDQGACASPRLLVWHDPDGRWAAAARRRFHDAMDRTVAAHDYEALTGGAIAKMVRGYRSIMEQAVNDYHAPTNEATWLGMDDLAGYDRDSPGGGIFYEYVSQDLDKDLSLLVTTRDQTAGYFGVDVELITQLARSLNGRGVDRWVPIGRALDFERVWDGYDLVQEFTKKVIVPHEGTH